MFEFVDGGVSQSDIYSGSQLNKWGDAIRRSIGVTPVRVDAAADCECKQGKFPPNYLFKVEVYTLIQYDYSDVWRNGRYGENVSDPRVKGSWNSFYFMIVRRRMQLVKDHEERHRMHARKNYDNVVKSLREMGGGGYYSYDECVKAARDYIGSAVWIFQRSDEMDYKKVEHGRL